MRLRFWLRRSTHRRENRERHAKRWANTQAIMSIPYPPDGDEFEHPSNFEARSMMSLYQYPIIAQPDGSVLPDEDYLRGATMARNRIPEWSGVAEGVYQWEMDRWKFAHRWDEAIPIGSRLTVSLKDDPSVQASITIPVDPSEMGELKMYFNGERYRGKWRFRLLMLWRKIRPRPAWYGR